MRLARKRLRRDYELVLLASSKKPTYRPFQNDFPARQDLVLRLHDQLHAYDRFLKGVLCGSTSNSGSPATLLNQGPDAHIKRTIASFCDFPQGPALIWLFKATINLRIPGPNPLREDDVDHNNNYNIPRGHLINLAARGTSLGADLSDFEYNQGVVDDESAEPVRDDFAHYNLNFDSSDESSDLDNSSHPFGDLR